MSAIANKKTSPIDSLESSRKSLENNDKKRIHITKLVHECLPTLERQNKFDGGKRKCPGCAERRETRDHILKCHAVSRQKRWDNFFQAIKEFHAKEDTNPLLRNLLNETMRDWLLSSKEINFYASPVLFHNAVRAVINHQN